MPSDGSGNFSLPAGYLAVTGTTILTTQHNPIFEDVATALTARLMRSGAGAMTGDLTLANSSPSSSLHAASKAYVDAQAAAAVAALDIKPSVNVASTGNLTLSAEQTIDGVLTSASRVLVKNQTLPAENGIYLTGSGAWARVTDMDAWTEVPGAFVAVEQGTIWKDTLWFCTADLGGTLNTTAITWRRFDTNKLRRADTTTAITIAADDHGRHITSSNAGAIATTLPQATTTFGFGFWFIIENIGAGANTITPTTSTINGAATLILRTNDAYLVTSDGANYRALNLGLNYGTLVGLTEDATGATGDFVLTADVSATLPKKVQLGTVQTLFAASQAQQEAATSNAVNVTPGRQQFHPSAQKAWVNFTCRGTNGACTINASYNVASVSRTATGVYDVTFTTAMSSVNYLVIGTCQTTNNLSVILTTLTTTVCTITQISSSAGTGFDGAGNVHLSFSGDQ